MRGFLKVFLLCAAALSMLLSGCKPKEETAEERTAREAREAREALEKLMRTSVTEYMALRFIEEKVHEMAEVPGLGDFRELVGTEWSSMPQPPAENALNIQKRLHEAGELRIDQAIQAVRAEEKTIRAALTKAADAAHPMFKAGDEVELTLARKGADIFVSGHSHILKVMYDNKYNLLHINPGAAGMSGFHKVSTLVRFVIDGTPKDLEIMEFPKFPTE